MALNPTPKPIVCGNWPRHTTRPPPATGVVVHSNQPSDRGLGLAPRCDPCIRELAAKPATAILVDVIDLGPARVGTHHDHGDDPTHQHD